MFSLICAIVRCKFVIKMAKRLIIRSVANFHEVIFVSSLFFFLCYENLHINFFTGGYVAKSSSINPFHRTIYQASVIVKGQRKKKRLNKQMQVIYSALTLHDL